MYCLFLPLAGGPNKSNTRFSLIIEQPNAQHRYSCAQLSICEEHWLWTV